MDQIELKKDMKEKLGITYLLPHQELVINHIAINEEKNKETRLLAVLPTGSGKSICFMAPLIFIQGIMIIIYPLLSLMSDQEKRMKKMNITTLTLKGGMDREEREEKIAALIRGEYKVLITNMEMLLVLVKSKRYEELWKRTSTLVLDEVHTAVSWGDTFRPSYKELPKVLEAIKPRHILAFTATLDDKMYLSIVNRVFFGAKPYLVKASADRSNIFYHSIHTLKMEEDLIRILKNKELRPAVVFCPSRRETERISLLLTRHLIGSLFYHGGMDKERRKTIEDKFYQSSSGVMVCTNAYGMGVSKNNIRCVIHTSSPKKTDEFLQEAGRAGRDGFEAHSFVLWQSDDKGSLKDVFSSGKCIRNGLLVKMGEEPEHEECAACSSCVPDGFVSFGEKEILREINRHLIRRRKSVINRLRRQSLLNPFPPLSKWSKRETEKAIKELIYSNYIKEKGKYLTLTKSGKKRLLQLPTRI